MFLLIVIFIYESSVYKLVTDMRRVTFSYAARIFSIFNMHFFLAKVNWIEFVWAEINEKCERKLIELNWNELNWNKYV